MASWKHSCLVSYEPESRVLFPFDLYFYLVDATLFTMEQVDQYCLQWCAYLYLLVMFLFYQSAIEMFHICAPIFHPLQYLLILLTIVSLSTLNGFPNEYSDWHILCWNIQGINAKEKWNAVRQKIEESRSFVVCLQETKRAHFDMSYIKKFAPRRFDCFDFIPLVGASRGILVLWNSSIFIGTVLDK